VTADGLTVQTTNGLNALLESTTSYQYLQFKNSAETNNFIGFVSDDFVVTPANNQKLIVTAEGSVGIGTSSLTEKLEVNGSINATNQSANFATGAYRFFADIVDASKIARIGTASGANTPSGTQGELTFYVNNTERMRIDADGDVGIGVTTSIDAKLKVQASSGNTTFNCFNAGSGSQTYIAFNVSGGGTSTGSITTNGSTTAYNTSSDYRLKENVVAMTGATERLKQLNPSRFNFIADADVTVDGFLAHEVQDIVPEAITGTKDAVDDDGNAVYQGIDQSKLVPLLVATIQELEARITELENN